MLAPEIVEVGSDNGVVRSLLRQSPALGCEARHLARGTAGRLLPDLSRGVSLPQGTPL